MIVIKQLLKIITTKLLIKKNYKLNLENIKEKLN